MKTTTTIAAALSAIIATGCATAPSPSMSLQKLNTEPGIVERAYSSGQSSMPEAPDWSGPCYSLRDLESVIRDGRANGMSADQQRSMLVLAAIQEGYSGTTGQKMAGALTYMVVDHVYSGAAGSAVDQCLSEKWPLGAYIATL